MVFPTLTENKKKHAAVNSAEAFYLWDITKSKFGALEKLEVWANFIHDRELLTYMELYIGGMKTFVSKLEKALERYGIKGPGSHAFSVRTEINTDIIRDQLIAYDMFTVMQEHIEMLLSAITSSTSNEKVRSLFIKQLKLDTDRIGLVMKYMKLKGWLGIPPMFPMSSSESTKLDAGEAFNLWGHLTFRYDNVNLTEIFLALANDGDFKAFLKLGQRMLLGQIRLLEEELKHFSIPGPIRPVGVQAPGDNQFVNDDHMFRSIYSGISGALSVHVKAVKQSTTNDRVRNLFARLLLEEIDTFDKAVKFGKLKGWLNPTPSFGVFKH